MLTDTASFRWLSLLRRICRLWMSKWGTVLLVLIFSSGCAQMRSHNNLMEPVLFTRNSQNVAAALTQLRSALRESEQSELLYALEIGELLREDRQYEASTALWLVADTQIRQWEETAMWNPRKLMAYMGAATVSERLKPYEGHDYEKVWLTTRLALNHMAMGDWASARVDIKRTHEREAVIARFRAAELEALKKEARQEGWSTNESDLGGYPVDYIDSPDVLKLQNGYQNALSHYLAGFLYEALGEASLAAPGYRQAIELKPHTPILENGLSSLDARMAVGTHAQTADQTDVLFIVETGDAPARISYEINIPFSFNDSNGNSRTIYVPISFPVIRPAAAPEPGYIGLDAYVLETTPIVDLNAMARRSLRDEMPGLILRGLARASSKGALQYYASEDESGVLGLLVSVFSVATEVADDRVWRTLPGAVFIARDYLPSGRYALSVNGRDSGETIDIHGRYALVPIRIAGAHTLVGTVATYGIINSVHQDAALTDSPP